jgi:hypothetical protein
VIGYRDGRRGNLPRTELGHAGYEAEEAHPQCVTAPNAADAVKSPADLALALATRA